MELKWTRTVKTCMTLMAGASVSDWTWFLRMPALAAKVKQYHCDSHSVSPAVGLPWPVTYILGRYNKKYIFEKRPTVKIQKISEALTLFSRKERWRWAMRKDETPLPAFKVPGGQLLSDPGTFIAPEVEAWLSHLRSLVISSVTNSKAYQLHTQRTFTNWIPIVGLGFQILSKLPVVAMMADKEAAYVISPFSDHKAMVQEAFAHSMYREFEPSYKHKQDVIFKEYKRICKLIAGQNEAEYKNLTKSLYRKNASIWSYLVTLVKTHKKPGLVKCRNIHANPAYPFAGLSMWVAAECRRLLTSK